MNKLKTFCYNKMINSLQIFINKQILHHQVILSHFYHQEFNILIQKLMELYYKLNKDQMKMKKYFMKLKIKIEIYIKNILKKV